MNHFFRVFVFRYKFHLAIFLFNKILTYHTSHPFTTAAPMKKTQSWPPCSAARTLVPLYCSAPQPTFRRSTGAKWPEPWSKRSVPRWRKARKEVKRARNKRGVWCFDWCVQPLVVFFSVRKGCDMFLYLYINHKWTHGIERSLVYIYTNGYA